MAVGFHDNFAQGAVNKGGLNVWWLCNAF
jgi:hypothetical protein